MFAQAIRPPTVPEGTSRLRLAVMSSHRRSELRDAARVLGRAARACGLRPGESLVPAVSVAEDRLAGRPFDAEAPLAA
ncbi:MAG: hypothetical protein ACR2K9_03820 [Solirubrobacteraceae bacterium]